jgi:hypothetical protein
MLRILVKKQLVGRLNILWGYFMVDGWVLTQEWVNATLSTKKKVEESAYQVEKDGVGCACGAGAASNAAAIADCNTGNNQKCTWRSFVASWF